MLSCFSDSFSFLILPQKKWSSQILGDIEIYVYIPLKICICVQKYFIAYFVSLCVCMFVHVILCICVECRTCLWRLEHNTGRRALPSTLRQGLPCFVSLVVPQGTHKLTGNSCVSSFHVAIETLGTQVSGGIYVGFI